jgi:hypothetical protein
MLSALANGERTPALPNVQVTKSAALQAFHGYCRLRCAARVLPDYSWRTPKWATKLLLCRHFQRTGATGLEPATSGVTGRIGQGDVRRRMPLIGVIRRTF